MRLQGSLIGLHAAVRRPFAHFSINGVTMALRKRGGVKLPFGGMKGSGHGREKGFEALYGFASLKTIATKH